MIRSSEEREVKTKAWLFSNWELVQNNGTVEAVHKVYMYIYVSVCHVYVFLWLGWRLNWMKNLLGNCNLKWLNINFHKRECTLSLYIAVCPFQNGDPPLVQECEARSECCPRDHDRGIPPQNVPHIQSRRHFGRCILFVGNRTADVTYALLKLIFKSDFRLSNPSARPSNGERSRVTHFLFSSPIRTFPLLALCLSATSLAYPLSYLDTEFCTAFDTLYWRIQFGLLALERNLRGFLFYIFINNEGLADTLGAIRPWGFPSFLLFF